MIILADKEIAEEIRESVQNAGFKQINKPYNLDEVIRAVDSSLGY